MAFGMLSPRNPGLIEHGQVFVRGVGEHRAFLQEGEQFELGLWGKVTLESQRHEPWAFQVWQGAPCISSLGLP